MRFAVGKWRFSRVLPETAHKVGDGGEIQFGSDVADRDVRVDQHPPGFIHDFILDILFGTDIHGGVYDFI